MLSHYRNWALVVLAVLSLSSVIAHRLGVFSLHLDLLDANNYRDRSVTAVNKVTANFLEDTDPAIALCQLHALLPSNYCALNIRLSPFSKFADYAHGVDLSNYHSLNLALRYQAPGRSPKLRITFRNYDPFYVKPDDYTSFKYNSLSVEPEGNIYSAALALQSFSVEPWWIDQHNIPSRYAGLDFSNVPYIEIIAENMTQPGLYRIELEVFDLVGEVISEEDLLLANMIMWLVVSLMITVQRNQTLKRQNKTDPLTHLFNRKGLSMWVNYKLNRFYSVDNLTLFFVDLDDFKRINDGHGHNIGDEVLKQFGDKLRGAAHAFDNQGRFKIARLAGDEFALVMRDLDADEVSSLAKKLLADIALPMALSTTSIKLNASIGISCSSAQCHSFEQMLHQADVAMYYAKQRGKNRYKKYDDTIAKDSLDRKEIATKLAKAIDDDEFSLVFMPIYRCKSRIPVKAEVLLRNTSQALAGIGPDVFIPIAEEYHLINKIDLWVIEHAFEHIQAHRASLNLGSFCFCINISARELSHEHFSAQFSALIIKYDIQPKWIELELTETSLVDVTEHSIAALSHLRAMGVSVALDDFGTGYTAFNQLINYPVDCLKIDKSFIDDLSDGNKTKSSMVKAMLSIAQSFELEVVAEGIETEEQLDFMLKNGCEYAQGYLLSKPVPFATLLKLIDPVSYSA